MPLTRSKPSRRGKLLTVLLVSAAGFLAGIVYAPLPRQSAAGPPQAITVIDGDTLEIEGEIFGLDGIDAPEVGQTCLQGAKRWRCGLEAARTLQMVTALDTVQCTPRPDGTDVPKATCVAGATDLAETLLKRGYAIALPGAPAAYAKAEADAKAAGLGIWRGKFVKPAEWRAGVRLPDGPADTVEACDVKGTVNDKDQKVYYVPTDKDYDKITIDPARGERLFCSDDSAVLAGWRRYPRP